MRLFGKHQTSAGGLDPVEPRKMHEILQLLKAIRSVWPLMADQKLRLGLMIILGAAAAIAEGVGFSLVILLIYILIGGSNGLTEIAGHSGTLGSLLLLVGHNVLSIGLVIAALVLTRAALTTGYGLLADWIASTAADRARVAIFDYLLRARFEDVGRQKYGSLLNTVSAEARTVSDVIIKVAGIVMNALAMMVYLSYIFLISSFLAGLVVALGLVLFGTLALWARWLGIVGAEVVATNRELFTRMLRGIGALRTIRMYGAENSFGSDFAAFSQKVVTTSFRLTTLRYISRPIRDVGLLAVLGTLLWLSRRTGAPTTVTVTVVALLYRLLPHVTGIEDDAMAIFGVSVPLQRAVATMNWTKRDECPQNPESFNGLKTSIILENIGYCYAGAKTPALADASIMIERGETVVIRGPNGSGKTTLVNLLARLYEPQTGRILIDGVPLDAIDRTEWLRRTAFAGQDVDLVDDSILDNVRFGRTNVSLQDVREALRIAGILEFVDALPERLDTKVGDSGLRLSGGERQRIGLARALAAKPDILVLDEATSAVDPEAEAAIFTAIGEAFPASTLIVITHRLNANRTSQVATLKWGRLTSIKTEDATRMMSAV